MIDVSSLGGGRRRSAWKSGIDLAASYIDSRLSYTASTYASLGTMTQRSLNNMYLVIILAGTLKHSLLEALTSSGKSYRSSVASLFILFS